MLQDPRAQLQQAYGLIKAGQKPQAFAVLQPLIQLHPESPEGWWLAANAAPTLKFAVEACQRVLALKPDYTPAIHMLAEQQLLEALSLLEDNKKIEARSLAQAVIERQPDNTRAWWLMAQAAPTQIDAVLALQKLLAIEPDNTSARQMLMDLQEQSARGLQQKHKIKDTKPKERKTRPWAVIGLLSVIAMVIAGGYFAMTLTGTSLGLPVGSLFNARYSVGSLGDKAVVKTGTLVVGAKHEYSFYARGNTHVLIMVSFPVLKSDPTKAIKLLTMDNRPVTLGTDSAMSIGGQYDVVLPSTGTFTLRITGMADIAQGPYQLYLMSMPDDVNYGQFGSMSLP